MAIYHCSVKTTSRSAGLSSVARAAYRSAEVLKDNRTGITYDYSKKSGVVFKELFLPNSPGIFSDVKTRSDLWNLAEQTEKRVNSTVAREFEISLPDEFSLELQIALAQDFSSQLVKKFDFAADLSIHIPKKRRRDSDLSHENAHGHLYCFTRSSDGKKTRALDEKKSGAIDEVRKMWEVVCNDHLKKNGFTQKISCEKLPFKNLSERDEHNVRLLEKTERAIRAITNAIHKNNARAAAAASRRPEEFTPALSQRIEFTPTQQQYSEDANGKQAATNSRSGHDARRLLTSDRRDNRQSKSFNTNDRADATRERPAESGDYSTSRTSCSARRRQQSIQKFADAINKLELKLKSLQSEINIEAIKNMEQKNGDSTRKTGSEESSLAAAVRSLATRKNQNQQRENQTGSQNTVRGTCSNGNSFRNFSHKL